MRRAADDLALDDHRIDDAAAVVDDDVAQNAHAAGLDVDLDLDRVAAAAIGERARQEALHAFEPRLELAPASHSRARPTPPRRPRAGSARCPARRRSRCGRRALRDRRDAASSRWAATSSAFSRTATAARCTAEPAVTVCRLAKPPWPWGMTAVSPAMTVTVSGDTANCSAQICASAVLIPCPMGIAPV